jgi:hypothetical protein
VIKFSSVSRSPTTAAAGSGVLILAALVGVVLAAGSGGTPSAAAAQTNAGSVNLAPVVLPKPCVATTHHQVCGAAASKSHRAKQVKKQPVQASAPPVPPVVPNPTSP